MLKECKVILPEHSKVLDETKPQDYAVEHAYFVAKTVKKFGNCRLFATTRFFTDAETGVLENSPAIEYVFCFEDTQHNIDWIESLAKEMAIQCKIEATYVAFVTGEIKAIEA